MSAQLPAVDEISLLFTGQGEAAGALAATPPHSPCLLLPQAALLGLAPRLGRNGHPHRPGHGPCPLGQKTHVCPAALLPAPEAPGHLGLRSEPHGSCTGSDSEAPFRPGEDTAAVFPGRHVA